MGLFSLNLNTNTGNGTYNISPPLGYKWILKLGFVQIQTSTGTGTRSNQIILDYGYRSFLNYSEAQQPILSLSTATASATQSSDMAPYVGKNAPSSQNYPDFEIGPSDRLIWEVSGHSGSDNFLAYIEIEEIPDL